MIIVVILTGSKPVKPFTFIASDFHKLQMNDGLKFFYLFCVAWNKVIQVLNDMCVSKL